MGGHFGSDKQDLTNKINYIGILSVFLKAGLFEIEHIGTIFSAYDPFTLKHTGLAI